MIPKHWLQGGQRMKNSWSWCVCPETTETFFHGKFSRSFHMLFESLVHSTISHGHQPPGDLASAAGCSTACAGGTDASWIPNKTRSRGRKSRSGDNSSALGAMAVFESTWQWIAQNNKHQEFNRWLMGHEQFSSRPSKAHWQTTNPPGSYTKIGF